jgi:hypothetical protein
MLLGGVRMLFRLCLQVKQQRVIANHALALRVMWVE